MSAKRLDCGQLAWLFFYYKVLLRLEIRLASCCRTAALATTTIIKKVAIARELSLDHWTLCYVGLLHNRQLNEHQAAVRQ